MSLTVIMATPKTTALTGVRFYLDFGLSVTTSPGLYRIFVDWGDPWDPGESAYGGQTLTSHFYPYPIDGPVTITGRVQDQELTEATATTVIRVIQKPYPNLYQYGASDTRNYYNPRPNP